MELLKTELTYNGFGNKFKSEIESLNRENSPKPTDVEEDHQILQAHEMMSL